MRKAYDFSLAKRGPVIRQEGKTRITMYLDDDVLAKLRERAEAAGRGYQAVLNEVLRDHLRETGAPLDARTLRRIIREELSRTAGT